MSEKNNPTLIYIASPYSGDTEINISRAQGYCRFAVSQGCMPIAPNREIVITVQ